MPNKKDLSSLGSLTSSNEKEPESSSSKRPRRSVPAWLLPFGLMLGFLLVLVLLFGKRLVPAVPVRVAPVISIRSDKPVELIAEAPLTAIAPASAQAGPGPLLFQASGWVEPDPFPIAVSTLVSGIVEEVLVLEGESVSKGQILARLVDEDAILELRARKARVETLAAEIQSSLSRIPVVESRRNGSQSNIASEQGRLAELEDRLSRLRSLPRGSIPAVELTSTRLQVEQQKSMVAKAASDIPGIDSELEMVKSQIDAKRSALREAQVAVDQAQLALDRHIIKSPIDGKVLILFAAPGRKMMMDGESQHSAHILHLFEPDKLQARIDVPLSEARGLSVGQPVEMSCDLLPSLVLKGVVTRITGEADLQRNTLQVKVEIKNPDSRLRPEMLVRAKFYAIPKPPEKLKPGTLPQSRTVSGTRLSIYVPVESIFNSNQVWVVGLNQTAELRTLSLGKDTRDGHQIAVSGVNSGELVILPPHTKLKQGARVTITKS